MRCGDLDGDLLMLAHGGLEGWQAVRARLHLALCPACRRRARKFDALSLSLVSALRNPTLGARSLARPSLPWGAFGFIVVSFIVLGLLVSRRTVVAPAAPVESCAQPRAVVAPVPAKGSCHPDSTLPGAKRE